MSEKKDYFKNPYFEKEYTESFGEFETDGFQEWNNPCGMTVFNVSNFDLMVGFIGIFVVFLVGPAFGFIGILINFSFFYGIIFLNHTLKTQYGKDYFYRFWWRNLFPLLRMQYNDFIPFDYPKRLKKMNLVYEINQDYNPEHDTIH